MAINLDRAEAIGGGGSSYRQTPITYDPNLKFVDVEVLTTNKVPLNRLSFIKDGYHICPTCQSNTLKALLDYRCTKCNSKVIKWKSYVDEVEEKHQLYDSYISRFYEASQAMTELINKKKASKDGRNISQ